MIVNRFSVSEISSHQGFLTLRLLAVGELTSFLGEERMISDVYDTKLIQNLDSRHRLAVVDPSPQSTDT